MEIDIEKERAKHQALLDSFLIQFAAFEKQRGELLQAINERRGVIIFLDELNQTKQQQLKMQAEN